MRGINADGVTVVVVEQINVALLLAERAVFMEKGRVRFAGPTADLLERPDVPGAGSTEWRSQIGAERRATAAPCRPSKQAGRTCGEGGHGGRVNGTGNGWVFRTPPGWPTPPAGWTPPASWRPDPAWPPAPAGWVWWVPVGVPTQAPNASLLPTQRATAGTDLFAPPAHVTPFESRPALPAWAREHNIVGPPILDPISGGTFWPFRRRSHKARVWLLVGYVATVLLSLLALAGTISEGFVAGIERENYASEAAYLAAYDEAYYAADPYIGLAFLVSVALFIGLLAHRGGYRWFDFAFVLVPVWGFVVLARLLWRWTDVQYWNLESEDWTAPWTQLPTAVRV